MAYTQADLDELDEAIASGELSVTVEGRAITYRSIDALLLARRHVAKVLRSQSSTRRRSPLGSSFNVTLDRGL